MAKKKITKSKRAKPAIHHKRAMIDRINATKSLAVATIKPSEISRGGRPTEWTAELIDIETKELYKWIEDKNNYFITGFLNLRGLHHENIERFARENEKFRAAYRLAKQIQEQRLVELAVTRKGDGGFIKFILQNKAGWKEKNEISGDVNNPLAVIMDTIGKNSRDPLEEYSEE